MTATDSSSAIRKKLLTRIAATQRQADGAKKLAKLAKGAFKAAKQKLKDAKRAAKKQRKELKALKGELAALAAKRKPVRKVAAKPVAKRGRPPEIAAPERAAEQAEASQSLPPSVESVPPLQ